MLETSLSREILWEDPDSDLLRGVRLSEASRRNQCFQKKGGVTGADLDRSELLNRSAKKEHGMPFQ